MSFGTGIVPQGYGYALQNRGAGFSLEPGHANVLAPGKRPYHTIIPGLMTVPDGGLQAVFGVMGGFMQPQGHVQVVSALVDDGIDPQAALDRPRFQLAAGSVATLPGAAVRLEEGLEEVAGELQRRGHRVLLAAGDARPGFGRGQVIWRTDEGVLWGRQRPTRRRLRPGSAGLGSLSDLRQTPRVGRLGRKRCRRQRIRGASGARSDQRYLSMSRSTLGLSKPTTMVPWKSSTGTAVWRDLCSISPALRSSRDTS